MCDNPCAKGLFQLHAKCVCDRDLKGTVSIVTGANCGIGYETAKVLADKGSRVILACRSESRGKDAIESLKKENSKRQVDLEILDLGSLASIRAFAERLNTKLDKLDLLINNAGLCTNAAVTEDGFEIHFGVNHLGHFLLTNLLLDKLKAAPEARIVNVSSLAHRFGTFDPSTFKKPFDGWKMKAYGNSKLHNILFTKELSERLKGTNITTFSLHPGSIDTNFSRDFNQSAFEKYVIPLLMVGLRKTVLKTSEQGAQTTLHAALNKDLTNKSGAYLSDCAITTPSCDARNEKYAKELWTLSEQFTGVKTDS